MAAAHAALAPRDAGFPIFEHCLPFNVQRAWDELDRIDRPRIWTAERTREVWDALQDWLRAGRLGLVPAGSG